MTACRIDPGAAPALRWIPVFGDSAGTAVAKRILAARGSIVPARPHFSPVRASGNSCAITTNFLPGSPHSSASRLHSKTWPAEDAESTSSGANHHHVSILAGGRCLRPGGDASHVADLARNLPSCRSLTQPSLNRQTASPPPAPPHSPPNPATLPAMVPGTLPPIVGPAPASADDLPLARREPRLGERSTLGSPGLSGSASFEEVLAQRDNSAPTDPTTKHWIRFRSSRHSPGNLSPSRWKRLHWRWVPKPVCRRLPQLHSSRSQLGRSA